MFSPIVESIVGASAVGQGAANDLESGVRAHHGLFVTTSAGVSAGTVTLMGSMDGVNWVATTTTVSTTSANATLYANLADSPFRYVAAKITTAITGGTISAWVASA